MPPVLPLFPGGLHFLSLPHTGLLSYASSPLQKSFAAEGWPCTAWVGGRSFFHSCAILEVFFEDGYVGGSGRVRDGRGCGRCS